MKYNLFIPFHLFFHLKPSKMVKIRLWLSLLVLSATCSMFNNCIFPKECDCEVPLCYSDLNPPDPLIQFNLIDSLGRSLSVINVTEFRQFYIDSLNIVNANNNSVQSKVSACNRDICFKFDEVPNRGTINKFISKKYFIDIHFKNKGWDRDTLLISYKTDSLDCGLDSIKFFYNDNFSFLGLNRSRNNQKGFDFFNSIKKF